MRRRCIRLASAAAAAVVVAGAMTACAETCSLQIKRLEAASGPTTGPPSDQMFRGLSAQRFYRRTGANVASSVEQSGEAEFSAVIKKEPPSYNSKSPLRAVAKLGTQQFGFVLDSREAEKKPDAAEGEAKKPASPAGETKQSPQVPDFGRLLFDLNHNGDLTDDPVIEAQANPNVRYPPGYTNFEFPRVDLTVEAEGTKIDYAFLISGYAHSQYLNQRSLYQYVSASLSAAAYRDGEITLDGKRFRIVVTDFNSNGRFDDLSVLDDSITYAGGGIYLRPGDMVYVDPQPQKGVYGYDPTTSDESHHLTKMIKIGERFYSLQITPAGDKLTLEPSPLAVGHVRNPNQGYRALVYGDQGVLKVSGDAEGRAPLPVGQWKLLMYTIDRTGVADPDKPAAKQPSLLQSLANAMFRSEQASGPKYTMVSARASRDYPAVEVRAGETAELRFGPPYKPQVTGTLPQAGSQASLGLSLVGVGGEVCSNLMVDGGRPAKPAFTIADPDGKVVQSGNFEYG
ncbi:MAG TPA: hypothetical protein PLF81_06820 [Candidatus Anammoximicrobium sp.]|nr:hypothetical protein [Candidatus Anammoximicrobium sp.]